MNFESALKIKIKKKKKYEIWASALDISSGRYVHSILGCNERVLGIPNGHDNDIPS
jgi:hypothetical protein